MRNECKTNRRHRGVLIPIVLIVLGVAFLLEKNGIIDRQLISQWWPLVLVFVGGWLLVSRVTGKDD